MKFLSFLRRFPKASFTVTLMLLLITGTASAASLPTLGTRLYYILGNVLFGGMIAPASTSLDTTSVAGHAVVLPEFASATTLKTVTNATSRGFPYEGKFIAYVRGTGSTTLRYSAACFKNPFQGMSGGSGVLLRLEYHAGNNPTGIGGDIGFVKSCHPHTAGLATASGSDIIDNVCTASGCVSQYTTGTANWNAADYIKFTPRGNLTSSYTGRITGTAINTWGE